MTAMKKRATGPAAKVCRAVSSTLPTEKAALAVPDKSRSLQITRDPTKSEERQFADLVTQGLATNASVALRFIKAEQGEVSLTEMVESLRDQGNAANTGDLSSLERMLSAQAVALNAMFGECARRAALNMGEHLDASETYMRLALKAQTQCRATIETLAAVKNPPVVFARQANINNGGQQQVNNGVATPAHTAETQSRQTKQLEDTHGQRLDPGAQSASGRTHQDMAPVGVLNRTNQRSRKGNRCA